MANENKTQIIVGFPGIGMSYFANHTNKYLEKSYIICDLNAADYEREMDWPANYIRAVVEAYLKGEYDFVFVGIEPEVRKALQKRGIPYLIVAPYLYGLEDNDENVGVMNVRLRDAYKRRWLNSGKSLKFIKEMSSNWGLLLRDLGKDDAAKIWLFDRYEAFGTILDLRGKWRQDDYTL